MMKRWLIFTGGALLAGAGLYFACYWIQTQPIWILNADEVADVEDIPERNKQIVRFIEANGNALAPDYKQVVCTEFVINVIEEFTPLTTSEANTIRIITHEDIAALLRHESPVIKGVHTSLVDAHKGVHIKPEAVQPGDLGAILEYIFR